VPVATVPSVVNSAAAQAAQTAPSNTVAIVGIIVAGCAVVAAALIAAVSASRRSKRELSAANGRHQAALGAERERLDLQLQAEAGRLAQTLTAEDRRLRRGFEREVLDTGAVLLARFRAAMSEVKPSKTPGLQEIPPDFMTVVGDTLAFGGRLRLWFDDDGLIVAAFDDVLKEVGFLTELTTRQVDLPDGLLVQEAIDGVQAGIEAKLSKYFAAARDHLRP
jgi:hypothetical protein